MQVGRASSGSFDATPARSAASSSNISLPGVVTNSTTSGSTAVSPSGAKRMFLGLFFRTGIPGTSSIFRYPKLVIVPRMDGSSCARLSGNGMLWVYEPTGQL